MPASVTREAFVGTWSLTDYLLIRADGVIRKPWGEDVSGLLIYSPEGYMSANLMPAVHKDGVQAKAAPAPPAKSHRSSRHIAYAGRYTLENDSITHHVEVSLFPSWIGLPQVRFYEIASDRLVLRTPPIPRSGKHLVGELTWKRICSFT
ncbi:MAG TPA: lipocalin-like domain-containing protein [Acidisarcina sp.]